MPPAPSSDDPLRPGKELLTAWLLHLLERRATYGYQLRRELEANAVSIDPGTMYRRLARLEQSGWVQSRWMPAANGPRRRLYRLTAKGRRALNDIGGLIQTIHDTHEAFIVAYEHPRPAHVTAGAGTATALRPPRSETPGPRRKLLTAWLLLFLRDGGQSYGYDLRRRLAEAQLAIQPAVLYRRLRALEEEARVVSHWGSSSHGPPPRVYELTSDGRRDLDELASQINAARGAMNAFLTARSVAAEARALPRFPPS